MSTTTAKPPALCARCPSCGSSCVPVVRGVYAAHRRARRGSWSGATEACPNNRKPVPDEAIAQWVAWELDNSRNAMEYTARGLAAARATLAHAEASDADARARLAAITAIAAARGIAPKDPAR